MDLINIRLVEEKDATPLFYLVNESRQHLTPFLPWAHSIRDVNDELKFIQSVRAQQLHKQQYAFVIEKGSEIVGMIDLHNVNHINHQAEVGYWLSKNYTGQGIVSIALKKIHDYAFKQLKLHKLVILVDNANTKSIQVAKRANYHHEGTLVDDKYYNNTYHTFERFAFIYKETDC